MRVPNVMVGSTKDMHILQQQILLPDSPIYLCRDIMRDGDY